MSRLGRRVPSVIGIDTNPATSAYEVGNVVRGDVLTTTLRGEPFDLVTCYATLHHLPLAEGLMRLRDLTAPGGTLIVVGLARESSPSHHAISAVATAAHHVARRFRDWHSHGSVVSDPTDTYSDVKSAARELLPGVRYRRRLYWRYSLEWTRP